MTDEKLLATLTADIVSAHVSNNQVPISDLATLIRNVHGALSVLGKSIPPASPQQLPAVPVRASVKPAFIVCLEDGKKLKML
jgi:predicted transcriptional regulator